MSDLDAVFPPRVYSSRGTHGKTQPTLYFLVQAKKADKLELKKYRVLVGISSLPHASIRTLGRKMASKSLIRFIRGTG